eukprot:1950395-Rhodomonas_salina.2
MIESVPTTSTEQDTVQSWIAVPSVTIRARDQGSGPGATKRAGARQWHLSLAPRAASGSDSESESLSQSVSVKLRLRFNMMTLRLRGTEPAEPGLSLSGL